MTQANAKALLQFQEQDQTYSCLGSWTIYGLGNLSNQIEQLESRINDSIIIETKALTQLDSAGVLCLLRCKQQLEQGGGRVQIQGLNPEQLKLFKLIASKQSELSYQAKNTADKSAVYRIGEETCHKLEQTLGFINLLGDISDKLKRACQDTKRFQPRSIIANISSTGITALPILGLLSFLIGVVLAYQLGLQLENYGANAFIAYISGTAIFREFGPLISAIIVAGRTSSAFTAQIGSMKINEEIDALKTMGLSPTELLVLPKVLGLLLAFPLLLFWSDFFSILGSMYMSKLLLNVGYIDFLQRLQDSVGFKPMLLGLYKAPAFAILIAMVGCFQGFRVQASADSVGSQTTKSVVQALFLIIIADAAYSVIYSWLDL